MILSSGGINVNHHFFNSQQYENCNKEFKKKSLVVAIRQAIYLIETFVKKKCKENEKRDFFF